MKWPLHDFPSAFTFQISGSVGIFWKNPSEVGDGGDCHSHHPLDEHKGLLFGFQLILEQSCPLLHTQTKTSRIEELTLS